MKVIYKKNHWVINEGYKIFRSKLICLYVLEYEKLET